MPLEKPDLTAALDLGWSFIERVARETADAPGVTRVAYGEGEARAFAIAAETAAHWRAEVARDAAGNQFLTLAGRDRSRTVLIGSHLDSVPHGGDYDGTAGVALGLAVASACAANGIVPACDLTVLCLRAEESCWFPHSYIGSKTALGILETGVLDTVRRSDTQETLATHMRLAGFDPEAVAEGRCLIDADRVLAYIEPHIEQAPSLIAAGLGLGVVTGIRGSFRYRTIAISGEYVHSGAMPRALRRDAAMTGAMLMTRMQALWEELERDGHDLTVTFGEVTTDPAQHSFSKVPGALHMCLDVRSQSETTLDLVERRLETLARECETRYGTRIDLGPRSGSRPAPMSGALGAKLGDALDACGHPRHEMASGAGHDAATFALAGIPATMIFIRNANGSHNPRESMAIDDFRAALEVLMAFVMELSVPHRGARKKGWTR